MDTSNIQHKAPITMLNSLYVHTTILMIERSFCCSCFWVWKQSKKTFISTCKQIFNGHLKHKVKHKAPTRGPIAVLYTIIFIVCLVMCVWEDSMSVINCLVVAVKIIADPNQILRIWFRIQRNWDNPTGSASGSETITNKKLSYDLDYVYYPYRYQKYLLTPCNHNTACQENTQNWQK